MPVRKPMRPVFATERNKGREERPQASRQQPVGAAGYRENTCCGRHRCGKRGFTENGTGVTHRNGMPAAGNSESGIMRRAGAVRQWDRLHGRTGQTSGISRGASNRGLDNPTLVYTRTVMMSFQSVV